MRDIVRVVLLLVVLAFVPAGAPEAAPAAAPSAAPAAKPGADAAKPGIQWLAYDEGVSRAQASGRMLLINFWGDWCGWCKKMKAETFTDAAVIAAVNRDFVPVSLNTGQDRKRAAEYGVRSVPVIWFVEKDGRTRITNLPGYVDAPTFGKILRFMGTRAFEKMDFKTFVEKGL